MKKYQVVVGNIGHVLETDNGREARREYRAWIRQSKAEHGRASGEPVTLFQDGEIRAEYFAPKKKMKLPTIKQVSALLRALKKDIGDEYRASDDPCDDTPGMAITIGINPETGDWSYQTGDNSYTGGAYGYHYWGVGSLYRSTNCRELARELIDDAADQVQP